MGWEAILIEIAKAYVSYELQKKHDEQMLTRIAEITSEVGSGVIDSLSREIRITISETHLLECKQKLKALAVLWSDYAHGHDKVKLDEIDIESNYLINLLSSDNLKYSSVVVYIALVELRHAALLLKNEQHNALSLIRRAITHLELTLSPLVQLLTQRLGNVTIAQYYDTTTNGERDRTHCNIMIYVALDGNKKWFLYSHQPGEVKQCSQVYSDLLSQARVYRQDTWVQIISRAPIKAMYDTIRRWKLQTNYYSGLGFFWSFSGPIDGMTCVKISESSDPHTWNDNYLCLVNNYLEWQWSSAGPLPGWNSIRWFESSDPDSWGDNYLCYRGDSKHQFMFANSGPPNDWNWVKIFEPSEPPENTWNDNYFCWR